MHHTIAKEQLSRYFQVSEDDVLILDRLKGGMSNSNYVCEIKNQKYTFRIPGKNAHVFVDRNREIETLKLISLLHIDGNALVHIDPTTGYKISHYIEGTSLLAKNPSDYYEAAAKVLHQLHDANLQTTLDYQPYQRLSNYEVLVHQEGIEHDPSYFEIRDKFLRLRDYLDQFPKVFCHNDSQPSNFIDIGDELVLVDWEFGGLNDPLYDIACYGNFDFQYAKELLPVYLNRTPSLDEWKRLYLWRTFQCLQWHNVALYKEAIGLSAELHLDFKQIARNYITKANALYEGFLSLS